MRIHPSKMRAEVVQTERGLFIRVQDIKDALNDDEFVQHQMMMLAVAHKEGDGHVEGCRRMIGGTIATLTGELDAILKKKNL